jgi:hypothetical protein
MKNLSKLILFFLLVISTKLFGSHNFAGEILVEQTGPLTIKATIITYYRAGLSPADRSFLIMNWGDGNSQEVTRSNGLGEVLDDNTTKKNVYTQTHTFSNAGKYTVWMTDPNRTGGILNLNFPSSDLMAFHLQTTLTLVVGNNQKYNSTPVFKNFSIERSYVGRSIRVDNKAIDADGDSITYRLITPLQALNTPINKYSPVTDIKQGDNNKATLNPATGLFLWDAPQQAGGYTIALQAISYRNGVALDTTVRDLLFTVEEITANNELSERPLVQLGANPFAQESVLNFNDNIGSIVLSAYDLSGKLLLNVAVENPQSYRLTKSDLGSGVKLIKIKAARREQVLKIVIE